MTAATDLGRRPRPMLALARVLHCTEGQAYSAVIVAIVATTMVLVGVPDALRRYAEPRVSAPPAVRATLPAAPPPATQPSVPALGPAPSTDTAPASGIAAQGVQPAPESSSPVAAATPRTFATVDDPGAPAGVVLAPDGLVYVATDNGTSRGRAGPSVIIAFRPDGSVARRYTVRGQPADHTDGLTGLALDGNDGLIALDAATARVLRFQMADGSQQTLATLPDVPACALVGSANCEPGVQDHQPLPYAVAFDGLGHLYVTDKGQATIWRLDTTAGQPQAWYQSLDFAAGDGPAGIAIAPDGRVVFTVGTTLDPNAFGNGALYQLAVTATGAAGDRTLLTQFARDSAPTGVALGSSGRTYVTLRGANALVVLKPDHTEERRITELLDAPTGLAFRSSSLLVTNQSHTDRWAVIELPIDDTGAPLFANPTKKDEA